MIVRQADGVTGDPVDIEGAEGVVFRMLLGDEQARANFFMRQFNVAPGGHTPRHSHDWEHEVYVLAGEGVVAAVDGEKPIAAGNCILVAPQEEHQFRNTGSQQLKFLCLVPRTSA